MTETQAAIIQTRDMIMIEVAASCPCGERHIRNYLREQCAFDDMYMDDAIEELVEAEMITVDEDMIVDLPYAEAIYIY